MDIDTLMANSRYYANEAVSAGLSLISRLQSVGNFITRLLQLNPPTFEVDYTDIEDAAKALYNSVRGDSPQYRDSQLFSTLGAFEQLMDLSPATKLDVDYIRRVATQTIEDIVAVQDRFNEACLLFSTLTTYAQWFIQGTINISSDILDSGSHREGRIVRQIFSGSSYFPSMFDIPSTAQNLGSRQMSELSRSITYELYRNARKFGIEKALELAVAQAGFASDKYINIIKTVESILEIGTAQLLQRNQELRVNELIFKRDSTYNEIQSQLRTLSYQRWSQQFDTMNKAFSVLIQSNVEQLALDKNTIAFNLDRIRIQLKEFELENSIRMQAISAASNLYAQKAAGALSGLSALIAQIEQLTED